MLSWHQPVMKPQAYDIFHHVVPCQAAVDDLVHYIQSWGPVWFNAKNCSTAEKLVSFYIIYLVNCVIVFISPLFLANEKLELNL